MQVSPERKWQTLLDLFWFLDSQRREAFIHNDGYRSRRSSWSEVCQKAKAFALRLRAAHIQSGDKVLLWSENRVEWATAFWGLMLEGAIVVPIDVRSSEDFLLQVAEQAQPRLILVGDEVRVRSSKWTVWRITQEEPPTSPWTATFLPAPDDIAEIVFTSGSTGEPKGVVMTHGNLTANLRAMQAELARFETYLRILEPVRIMLLVPFSHLFGQQLGLFIPFLAGASVVLSHSYNPSEIARLIRRHRVVALITVPRVIESLSKQIRTELRISAERKGPWLWRWLRSWCAHRHFGWRFCLLVSGGAPLSQEQVDFWSRLGFWVTQGYGLTETAPIISFDDPLDSVPGSVGRPLPGTELRLASDGEILVRGDNVFHGYFQAAEATDNAFDSEGWFRTGDIGRFDKKGRLIVLGRKKELIVTPEGTNIFPEDVETVARRIPGVRDVAVTGTDHIHAVLALAANVDADGVVSRANNLLEPHQRIRDYSIWPGDVLPRTASTGKLRRGEIERFVREKTAVGAVSSSQGHISELIERISGSKQTGRTLDEAGLSSLDRVELMMALEERGAAIFDTIPLSGETTVAEIAAIETNLASRLRFPTWNRQLWARALRFLGLNLIVFPFVRIVARRTVQGRNYVEDACGPLLIASNHQSHLDTPLILLSLPASMRYKVAPVMWKEYFHAYFHPQGRPWRQRMSHTIQYFLACLFFNAFPIPQTEAGAWQSIRYCGELVDEGWSVLIFPEGERTNCGEIGDFRPGVAMIAERLKVPILPTRIDGAFRILHRTQRLPSPGPVRLTFGKLRFVEGNQFVQNAAALRSAVTALNQAER